MHDAPYDKQNFLLKLKELNTHESFTEPVLGQLDTEFTMPRSENALPRCRSRVNLGPDKLVSVGLRQRNALVGPAPLFGAMLVVHRENPRLVSLRNAILRMIRGAINAAHQCGKEGSVCGEMAARPELAIVLRATGIHALSVTPRTIPELKHELTNVRLAPLIAQLDSLLARTSTEDIEQVLRRHFCP